MSIVAPEPGLGLTRVVLQVAGQRLSPALAEALLSVRVDSGLRLPGQLTYVLVLPEQPERTGSDRSALFPAIGAAVSLSLDATPVFDGEVTAVEVEHDLRRTTVSVTASDLSHRLALSGDHRAFTQMTMSGVVTQIAAEVGLRPVVDDTVVQIPYLLQAGSHRQLLDELADHVGFDWWCDGKDLRFQKPSARAPVTTLSLERQLRSFRVRVREADYGSATVVGNLAGGNDPVSGDASAPSPAVVSSPGLVGSLGLTAGTLVKTNKTRKLLHAHQSVSSQEEAKGLAQSLLDDVAGGAVTAMGRSDLAPAVRPGSTVTIAGGGPATAGDYRVTEVEHTWSAAIGEWETRFHCGRRRPRSLVAGAAAGVAWPAGDGLFRHLGIVTARVSNLKDPDRNGRVKVAWKQLTGSRAPDGEESGWARVLSSGGGGTRGSVFLPEVGDEVVVGFENGDLRAPVVLGGVFNQANKAPADAITLLGDGKVAGRRITSRLGHVVELADGDAPAKQHVRLTEAATGSTLRVGADEVRLEAAQGKPLKLVCGDSSITFDGKGNIEIKGTRVTVSGSSEVAVSGATVKAAAQSALELQGATATIKGQATAEVSAGAMLTLKGSAGVAIN